MMSKTGLVNADTAHKGYTRIQWISQILSLDKFTDICQKVYFAVEDYSEVDVIIANGYLSYMFFEHDVATGLKGYRDHHRICRQNLSNAVLRLPLLLPPSMEAIAALTLGVRTYFPTYLYPQFIKLQIPVN
jgi:hypothetical protein